MATEEGPSAILSQELPEASIQPNEGLFGRGGKVEVTVLDRKEISVPIHLPELTEISSATAKAAFWWSVTTLAIGSAISFYLSGITISDPNAKELALTQYAPIGCALFAIVCLVAAVRETMQRNTIVHKIYRECGLEVPTLPIRIRRWLGVKNV
jgi:hypothetical protein